MFLFILVRIICGEIYKMIPKIIHYCWFGGKTLPEEVKQYINSWRAYCPDYEIMEWNESNFDVTKNRYCHEAYKAKKWAFVSDYVRLKVLQKYGGIYMDTDVEVVRSFDDLLVYGAFMCFENNDSVSIGTLGAEKSAGVINDFLSKYEERSFIKSNGEYDLTTNLEIVTKVLDTNYNLIHNGQRQILPSKVLVLPMESFIAKDNTTGWIMSDSSTYAIHHYSASWFDPELKRYAELHQKYVQFYIKKSMWAILKLASLRATAEFYGSGEVMRKMIKLLLNKSEGGSR